MKNEKYIGIVIFAVIVLKHIIMLLDKETTKIVINICSFILGIIVFIVLILGFINIISTIFDIRKNKGKVGIWLIVYMTITFIVIIIGIIALTNFFINKDLWTNENYFELQNKILSLEA